MKQKILLLLVMSFVITVSHAQKKKAPVTGYAITAAEKGGKSWREVRQIDIATGEEIKTVYKGSQEMEALNARTGKAAQKQTSNYYKGTITVFSNGTVEHGKPGVEIVQGKQAQPKRVINLDQELNNARQGDAKLAELSIVQGKVMQPATRVANRNQLFVSHETLEKPFATNSAACAYDKKNDRLYYTPMGINQLRYIDMKSKTPKVYYFEDEKFGEVKSAYDAPNQITRMTFAADGNGYALSNDGRHLIRFTTGKKPEITDLGAITNSAKNGPISIVGNGNYGGDMIADASNNLYVLSANRNVFKIAIDTKEATYLGAIKGLPKGFSTNGAMVETDGGSQVIIASSESTEGYYRFDLNTLQAEKVSSSSAVFNASDLANGNLAFNKKKKEKEEPVIVQEETPVTEEEKETLARSEMPEEVVANKGISIYPNPVTNGQVKVSFADQPAGKYQLQIIDLSGKMVDSREVTINGKKVVVELAVPQLAKGTYLVKITGRDNDVAITNKLIVQ